MPLLTFARGPRRTGFICTRETALPGWLGEPLDVGWAIDVLHPLARWTGAAENDRA
jgi:hypothetical protein